MNNCKDLNAQIALLSHQLERKELELASLKEALKGVITYMEISSKTPTVAATLSMAPSSNELVLNPKQKQIIKDSNVISLTSREFKIFEYLHKNLDKACSRGELVEQFDEPDMTARNVDVHIFALRKKLNSIQVSIETVWGQGYKVAL